MDHINMASVFNVPKPTTIETEISRLKAENQSLIEELTQCQADKDFVWSLWKRLQVASPDITQAVSIVVQREKEKAEIKDKKVLVILQQKDEKIDELQKLTLSLKQEVNSFITLKLELQNDLNCLKIENAKLAQQCEVYKNRVDELHLQDQNLVSRQAIREMDQQILDLKQQLSKDELEISNLRKDKSDLSVMSESQKKRIQVLEEDLKSLRRRNDDVVKDHTESKALVEKYNSRLSSLELELRDKTQELNKLRQDLADLWQSHQQCSEHSTQQADIIRQLRELQMGTQKMMKNQEEAFSMETKTIQAQLLEQEQLIAEYEAELEDLGIKTQAGRTNHSTQVDLGSRLRTNIPSTCDRACSPLRDMCFRERSPRSRSRSSSFTGRVNRSRSEPRLRSPPRSRSLARSHSPDGISYEVSDDKALPWKLKRMTKKINNLQNLLQVKNEELDEIRRAHNNRLERLHALQSNYRLLKKQLKLAEEELNGPRRKRGKIRRADVKSLQKEDSDSVWNELTYFRRENKNLVVDRMNLQEELDVLKVKMAQDAATVYELRSCLEQEREELHFLKEEQENSPSPAPDLEVQLRCSTKELRKMQKKVKSLEEDKQDLIKQQNEWLKQKRDMKSEVSHLQQKEIEYRMKIADQNKELARLIRELRRLKRQRAKSSIARKYQRILNKSVNHMKSVFDHFAEDGWEEVSDTEEQLPSSENVTVNTADSLGQAIAQQASMSLHSDLTQPEYTSTPSHGRTKCHLPTDRQTDSVKDHIERISKLNESPSKSRITAKKYQTPVHYRDVALSPIQFFSSHRHSPVSRATPSMTSVGTSPHVVSRKGLGSMPNTRQLNTLKQRVQTLQHQVTLLRTSRDHLTQKSTEQKDQISQLQSDLSSTNQKLQGSRLTVQRLTSDLERLRADKELVEQQMQEFSLENSSSVHTEQEWAVLQSKLKSTTNEITKQSAQIRQLKLENASQKEQIQQFQERINHLDRDITQKRTLLEDMRVKMRFAQENAHTDAEVMSEVEKKLKSLSDANSRYKTQVESFKQRLAAVTKEKYESEEKVLKLSSELERKSKQASELQRKNTELQSTVVAIEKTAQEQLHAVASQSEAAIDVAQAKLDLTGNKLREHEKLIKVFSHALLNSLQQARSLWQHQKQRKKAAVVTPGVELDPSLRRAQSLACDILNISQSDLEDIMNGKDGDADRMQEESPDKSEENKKDRKWSKRIEKVTQNKVEFAITTTELFMEKVEERCRLAAKLEMS
ncbi:hypothetical protein LSH36_835g00034 [Paralvinella palmiformis]|uniref:Centlein n=1 Tax=Paralvinella palmiformis TaxID=53620 RepID=A0AAD9IZY1_9ANNE|nr:hypothetical protein LSH36_835g00034 [Paralvinella palmiformis]